MFVHPSSLSVRADALRIKSLSSSISKATKKRLLLIVPALVARFKFTTSGEATTEDRQVIAMFSHASFAHTCSRKCRQVSRERKMDMNVTLQVNLWFLISLCLVCFILGGLLFSRGGGHRYR